MLSLLSTSTLATNEGITYNGIIIDSATEKNKLNKLTISAQGVVNIDIKAPDNNGVSHNQYLQFNTSKGVTVQLNNDAKQNKNMLAEGTQSAKLIINQVNSTEKTNLYGLLNITGAPAKVIIANPNGITCNDCQFNNTTGVDLIAGNIKYQNNTINYQTNKGKIIFTGLGIHQNTELSFKKNDNSKILSNLNVYAGNIRLKYGANVFVPKQYYAIGNIKTEIGAYNNFDNRKISDLEGEKTKFILEKNSRIYANQLDIFTSKGLHLNNKGALSITDNKNFEGHMSIKADRISNKHMIIATGNIKNNENIIPFPINITAKRMVNNKNAGIEVANYKKGIINTNTYQGDGYINNNIKINSN